jgi:hypothetical protein
MEHGRDEEQEDMLGEIIRDGDDITSQFLNGSGEGMEGEDDGSGVGTLIITKSGEVY